MNLGLSFDPDALISQATPTTVEHLFDIPADWRHGLDLLSERAVPIGATDERWAQIVADAKRIAASWGAEIIAAGWSRADVFAFDPADERMGLAVRLRGRRLTAVTAGWATIQTETGAECFYPGIPTTAALLWNFDRKVPA